MKPWKGRALLGIGVLHSIYGFVEFSVPLTTLVREGLFNTVNGQPVREAALWFLFSGFALMILGALVDWIERRPLPLPGFLRWSLSILTLLGCLIMPRSGFWLLIIPVAGFFRKENGTIVT